MKNLIQATFIKEQKTRFLCDIIVNGKQEECYVPSSCKLSKLYNMTKKRVLISAQDKGNTRTKYSLFAIKDNRRWILLNLSYVNQVVYKGISKRYFGFLGPRKLVLKEKTVDGYKTDLYIADQKCIVEIKTLLANEKVAAFPSVSSKRAIAQLIKLQALLDKGYKVLYIVASLNPLVKAVYLNDNDESYCECFRKCISKGMLYKAVSICIKNNEAQIYSSIGFNI